MRYETIPQSSVWLKDSSSLSSTGRVASLVASFQFGNATPALPGARPADLKAIDKVVALYEKAWSLMAKRNLTVDLNREIAAWERLHPGSLPMAIAALKDVVGRQLQASPSYPFKSTPMSSARVGRSAATITRVRERPAGILRRTLTISGILQMTPPRAANKTAFNPSLMMSGWEAAF
jgi:hypothetical protein